MSPRPALAALAFLLISACAPTAPDGIEQQALDDAVARAIGDPSTCVMILEPGKKKPVYRYNKLMVCNRAWPDCGKGQAGGQAGGGGLRTVEDLLRTTAKDGQARTDSCFTNPDGSRAVGWASGPIAGKDLVYAAVMEGDRALPGRIMAERLAAAFRKAGL